MPDRSAFPFLVAALACHPPADGEEEEETMSLTVPIPEPFLQQVLQLAAGIPTDCRKYDASTRYALLLTAAEMLKPHLPRDEEEKVQDELGL